MKFVITAITNYEIRNYGVKSGRPNNDFLIRNYELNLLF